MRMCETALFQFPVSNMTVGMVKMINMRHHAKFLVIGQTVVDRLAIFRFFKTAAAAVLDF